MKNILMSLLTCVSLSSQAIAHPTLMTPVAMTQDQDGDQVQLLFILLSKNGHIEKNKDGSYKLTMMLVDKNVVCFTDRPDRKANFITYDQFFAMWSQGGSNSFASDNPNAGLIGVNVKSGDAHSQPVKIAVILSNPQYNASTDTVVFTIRPVNKGMQLYTGVLGETILFVDSAASGPGAGSPW